MKGEPVTEEQFPETERDFQAEIFPQGDGCLSISFNMGNHDQDHLQKTEKMIESAAEIVGMMIAKTIEASNGDEEIQVANLNQLLYALAETNDVLDQSLCRVVYADIVPPEEMPASPRLATTGTITPLIRLDDYRSNS